MKIARVFPRVTKATPTDPLAFYDAPGLFVPDVDEVHVSVAFSWDMQQAEFLADQWRHVAPVKIGGPAFNQPGAAFVPGMYVRDGYVITSRGCPNRCWFCSVWQRENGLTELPVTEGWNLLDDNILACSEQHIRSVFAMLKRQPTQAQFTGGLEAARLKDWHVHLLADLRPKQMFFAYDTPDDYEPLIIASSKLREAGFTRNQMRCYCLIGGPRDTIQQAESRLRQCLELGFFPMAMLWRDSKGTTVPEWRAFQRSWARPALIYMRDKVRSAPLEIVEANLY
ncbi:MAG: hypothetical protein WC214_08165 [Candidatus Omnitrophota bacterium]